MTRDEARTILHACHPHQRDANDPLIAEALAFAENDPELRQWFEDSQALDEELARALKAAPIPADLLENVRAGAAARTVSRSRPGRLPLALAASLAFLGILAAVWLAKPPAHAPDSVAALRSDMAEFLSEFPRLDIAADRLPEVRNWLATQHSISEAEFPAALEQFPTIGCRTVEWQNKELALVCFMVEGHVVHFFMIPQGVLPDAGLESAPQYASAGEFNTAAWTADDRVYLALTRADEDFLQQWL